MFYINYVLAKKGKLAKIWLAAHWDKKLTKAQIFETNIEGSVNDILRPQIKLALRTSGHLMLGVVRIYSRKAKYLLADCNEALIKIKLAFRPGNIDLPVNNLIANSSAITMNENFYEFDFILPEIEEMDFQDMFAHHQSDKESITLKENINMDNSFYFGYMDTEVAMNSALDLQIFERDSIEDQLLNTASSTKSINRDLPQTTDVVLLDEAMNIDNNHLARETSDDLSNINPEIPIVEIETEVPINHMQLENTMVDDSIGGFNRELPETIDTVNAGLSSPGIFQQTELQSPQQSIVQNSYRDTSNKSNTFISNLGTTHSLTSDSRAFILGPIDCTMPGGGGRMKRKRKLIIDKVKSQSSKTMQQQSSNRSDLLQDNLLAPHTSLLMRLKLEGQADHLISAMLGNYGSERLNKMMKQVAITQVEADDDDDDDDQNEKNLMRKLPRIEEEEIGSRSVNSTIEKSRLDSTRASLELAHHSSINDENLENLTPFVASNLSTPKRLTPKKLSFIRTPLTLLPPFNNETLLPLQNENLLTPLHNENHPLCDQTLTPRLGTPSHLEVSVNDTFTPSRFETPTARRQIIANTPLKLSSQQENARTEKRMGDLMSDLRLAFENPATTKIHFKTLLLNCSKKEVVFKFSLLLVLLKQGVVSVLQMQPMQDILIMKGINF